MSSSKKLLYIKLFVYTNFTIFMIFSLLNSRHVSPANTEDESPMEIMSKYDAAVAYSSGKQVMYRRYLFSLDGRPEGMKQEEGTKRPSFENENTNVKVPNTEEEGVFHLDYSSPKTHPPKNN
eukprot:c12344_g1_i1 orf=252-617(-)